MRHLLPIPLLAACASAAPAPNAPATQPTATTAAATTPSAPAPKVDLAALAKRETTKTLAPTAVSALDGKLTATALASGPLKIETVPGDGGEITLRIQIPIGAEMPIDCFVHPGLTDGASWAKAVLPELPGAKADLPEVHVVVNGGRELLVSSHLRLKDAVVYQSKIGTSSRLGSSLLCHHGELGYTATFDRVVGGLASSLRFAGENVPLYVDVSEVTLGTRKVGMEVTTIFTREDGKRSLISLFTAFTPAGGSWVTFDGADVEVVEPTGELVQTSLALAIDGKIVEQYESARAKKRDYVVKGTSRGRAFDTVLSPPEPLTSNFVVSARRRAVAAGKPGPAEWYRVDYDASPPAIERGKIASRSGKTVVLTHGHESSTCEIDEDGRCAAVARDGDGEKLAFKRVFKSGAFSPRP
jgi:hypothetical protein